MITTRAATSALCRSRFISLLPLFLLVTLWMITIMFLLPARLRPSEAGHLATSGSVARKGQVHVGRGRSQIRLCASHGPHRALPNDVLLRRLPGLGANQPPHESAHHVPLDEVDTAVAPGHARLVRAIGERVPAEGRRQPDPDR